MRHIKLFEELRSETYISAADKLMRRGHLDRAKVLYDKSDQVINKSIDRIDPNRYEIEFKVNDYNTIQGIFQIVDVIKIKGNTYPIISAVDYEVIFQCGNKKVSIICGNEEGDDTYHHDWDEEGNITNTYETPKDEILTLWIRSITNITDEDDYERSTYQQFKFKNRKDARNFKKFLVEEFPGKCDNLSINSMY